MAGKLAREAVACPMCKKIFTIPENGVEGLPRNFFIEKLLTIRDVTRSQASRKMCESCEDAEHGAHATVFCWTVSSHFVPRATAFTKDSSQHARTDQ
jgi:hypothetical protein